MDNLTLLYDIPLENAHACDMPFGVCLCGAAVFPTIKDRMPYECSECWADRLQQAVAEKRRAGMNELVERAIDCIWVEL